MLQDTMPQDAIARCVASVASGRRSVRAFKPVPLPREVVEQILEDASTAPSGGNTQPWRVYVVTGAFKDALTDRLVKAFRAGDMRAPAHFPDPLPDPLPDTYRARVMDFGARYSPDNQTRTPRQSVPDFARMLGFPPA